MASSALVRDDLIGPREAWTTADATPRPSPAAVQIAGRYSNTGVHSHVICSPLAKEFPGVVSKKSKCSVEDGAELQRSQSLEVALDERSDAMEDSRKSALKLKLEDLCAVQKAASTECLITAQSGENGRTAEILLQPKTDKLTMAVSVEVSPSKCRSPTGSPNMQRRKLPDAQRISRKSQVSSPLARSDGKKTCEAQPKGEGSTEKVFCQQADKSFKSMEARNLSGESSAPPHCCGEVKKKWVKAVRTIRVVKTIRVPKSKLQSQDTGKKAAKTDSSTAATESVQSKSVVGRRGSRANLNKGLQESDQTICQSVETASSAQISKKISSGSSGGVHAAVRRKVSSDHSQSVAKDAVALKVQIGTGNAREGGQGKRSATRLGIPDNVTKDVRKVSNETSAVRSVSSASPVLPGNQSKDSSPGKPSVRQMSRETSTADTRKTGNSCVTPGIQSSAKGSLMSSRKVPPTKRHLTKTRSLSAFDMKGGREDKSSLSSASSRTTSRSSVQAGLAPACNGSRDEVFKGTFKSQCATLVPADAETGKAKLAMTKSSPGVEKKSSLTRQSSLHMATPSGPKRPLQKQHSLAVFGKIESSNEVGRWAERKISYPPARRSLRKLQSSSSLSTFGQPVAGDSKYPVKPVTDNWKTAVAKVDSGLRVKPKASVFVSSDAVCSASNLSSTSESSKSYAGDINLTSSPGLPLGQSSRSSNAPSNLGAKSKSTGALRSVEGRSAVLDNKLSAPSMQLSDADLQHIRDSSPSPRLSSFGRDRTSVKPRLRRRPSVNPVRQLQSRSDVKSELPESSKNEKRGRIQSAAVTLRVPEYGKVVLHDAARAGLASREDFKAVLLRKTKKAPDGTAVADEDDEMIGLGRPCLVVVQIKGRRRIQVHLVEPSVNSLNSGDVFIVFTPSELYQWVGSEANAFEKAKGTDLATRIIQKKDMGCKAKYASVIEQKSGITGQRLKDMLKRIGGDGASTVKSASGVPSDEDHEKKCIESVMIYSVKDGRDELVPRRELCGKSPRFAMLNRNEVFVFDFYTELYVWIGRVSLGCLRRQGATLAKNLFDKGYLPLQPEVPNGPSPPSSRKRSGQADRVQRPKNGCRHRPSWALFSKIAEGAETFLFKEKFADWPEPGRIIKLKGHVSSGEILQAALSAELVPCDIEVMRKPALPLEDCVLEGDNLGRGRGVPSTTDKHGIAVATVSVNVYHIKEYDYTKVDDDELGVFYSAEGYVIRWVYRVYKEPPKRMSSRGRRHQTVHEFGGREHCCYFFWQGEQCSVTEKGATAVITVELDEERGPQIRVPQGKEPPVFLQVFGGGIVVLAGKRPAVDKKSCEASQNRLFGVRGEVAHEALLEEIPTLSTRALRSQGCFVVTSALAQSVFVWRGCRATDGTRAVALAAAQKLMKKLRCVGVGENYELVEVNEGEEKMRFWRSIGGKYDYYSLLHEPMSGDNLLRLFQLSSAMGKFSGEEVLSPSRAHNGDCVFPFLQSDIYAVEQPALFLLEAHGTVYLWLGWWPGESDSGKSTAVTGMALSRWLQDKGLALKTVQAYARAISRRCPAYVVVAGFEPDQFTSLFPTWQQQQDIRDRAAHVCKSASGLLLVEDELKKLHKKYSVQELRLRPLPDTVDPIRLETYLTDADFQTVFKVTRDQFSKLPKWKQTDAKKTAGLF